MRVCVVGGYRYLTLAGTDARALHCTNAMEMRPLFFLSLKGAVVRKRPYLFVPRELFSFSFRRVSQPCALPCTFSCRGGGVAACPALIIRLLHERLRVKRLEGKNNNDLLPLVVVAPNKHRLANKRANVILYAARRLFQMHRSAGHNT